MGIIDSFINYLKHIKNKLVILIKGNGIPKEEKEETLKKFLQWKEKYPEDAKEFYKEIGSKIEKEKDDSSMFIFLEGLLIILIFSFSYSIFSLAEWSWDYTRFWYTIGAPTVLFFGGYFISDYYGKSYKYHKVILIMLLFFLVLHTISFSSYGVEPEGYFLGSLVIAGITYLFSKYMSSIFRLIISPNYEDITLYSYFRTDQKVSSIMDIIEKQMTYSLKDNPSSSYERFYDEDDCIIFEIDRYTLLFLTFEEKELSFVVVRRNGRYIEYDDECELLQDKINYIFEKILDFEKIENAQETKEKIHNQYNKQIALLNKYKKPKFEFPFRKYIRTIVALGIILISIFIIFHVIPKKIEEGDMVLIAQIAIGLLTILSEIALRLYFPKK